MNALRCDKVFQGAYEVGSLCVCRVEVIVLFSLNILPFIYRLFVPPASRTSAAPISVSPVSPASQTNQTTIKQPSKYPEKARGKKQGPPLPSIMNNLTSSLKKEGLLHPRIKTKPSGKISAQTKELKNTPQHTRTPRGINIAGKTRPRERCKIYDCLVGRGGGFRQ
jgi:hypothetical protein